MRIVLDTNILLSALIVRGMPPDRLYEEWRHGRFQLASAEKQIDELRQVVRRPFFLARLKASEIGRMVNDIRRLAVTCDTLPAVSRSPDPNDDYLVTGDKSHLLDLERHGGTRIVSAKSLVDLLGR